ncbi:hypothetical protein [Alicyclobacillus sacchari]|uniref:hypothetical protein n=1 Tax=Alicyclobacillus sacchari TaxID=392010 RepID=UPI0014170E4D|nr:hypothetical protein [Alicyclobacillus sacchari]
MAWVYYYRLVDTRFQADCLAARLEEGIWWMPKRPPRFIGVFQTQRGRYGVKVLWD